jgi:hypothetical protein
MAYYFSSSGCGFEEVWATVYPAYYPGLDILIMDADN